MTDETGAGTEQRRGGVATVVGAFTKGNRDNDPLIREQVKFISGWAKFGLAGLVIGALFVRQDADRREARDDRRAEREERAARDANLAAALIRLDGSISMLSIRSDQERESCWDLRLHRGKK